MYEISGTIKLIYDLKTFNSGFTIREFVITTDEKFEQHVKLVFKKDRTGQLDDFQEGDQVNVGFYIRGREYNDKYFVDLEAYKIERVEGGGSGGADAIAADEPAEDAEGDFPF